MHPPAVTDGWTSAVAIADPLSPRDWTRARLGPRLGRCGRIGNAPVGPASAAATGKLAGFADVVRRCSLWVRTTPRAGPCIELLSRDASMMTSSNPDISPIPAGLGAADALALFQQAPGFMCFLRGSDHVFAFANDAYLQLIGHRDIMGRTIREALPELEGQGYYELLDRVYQTGETFLGNDLDAMLQREPGVPPVAAVVDFIYQPVRSAKGHVVGIVAQGQEVTRVRREEQQRVVAEIALRHSEQRYRALFESIDDGFCLIQTIRDEHGKTVDYRFVETNAAFERQTGLTGAIGQTALALVPDLDASWFELYGRVADTGEPNRFENHAPAIGRWFDAFASRVGPPENHLVALVFKDVTERRRIEDERTALLEAEMTARQEAENANRLRDEFLATISHELRTPLTAILGWTQILRTGGLAPDKRARALETIERNAQAQAQLIEELLDVSAIAAGKLRLDVQVVDLHTVVESAIQTVHPAANAKGVRLQATLGADGTVMGDQHRLEQVVWNLLSNAVKFTPRGGRVQVLVERLDSSVEITVADTGRGIADDFQAHVFERFRQADGATTRAVGGLGLGLAIVRQLVELHGGTVSVYSEGEGRGATFTVRLPIAETRARGSEPSLAIAEGGPLARADAPAELAGLDLIVVDDEPDTREMLGALLVLHGARVRTAASASECLLLVAERTPHVLLSDIGMPGEDGYSMIAKLRARPRACGGAVPAVAITAFARTEDRTRALLAGFNRHVAKPVEFEDLLAVITSLAGPPDNAQD